MLLLPSELTNTHATPALKLLEQALTRETEATVLIDATALKQFDSAALAVLLECQRQIQAQGKKFQLRNAPAKLSALAKLYGLDGLLASA